MSSWRTIRALKFVPLLIKVRYFIVHFKVKLIIKTVISQTIFKLLKSYDVDEAIRRCNYMIINLFISS